MTTLKRNNNDVPDLTAGTVIYDKYDNLILVLQKK